MNLETTGQKTLPHFASTQTLTHIKGISHGSPISEFQVLSFTKIPFPRLGFYILIQTTFRNCLIKSPPGNLSQINLKRCPHAAITGCLQNASCPLSHTYTWNKLSTILILGCCSYSWSSCSKSQIHGTLCRTFMDSVFCAFYVAIVKRNTVKYLYKMVPMLN